LSHKTLIIYALAFVALVIVALLTDSPTLRIGAIGAIVGGILGDIVVRKIYAPYQTRKQYKSYKAAQEPTTVRSSEDGLYFTASIGDAKINWDRILKWREDSNFVLIYQAPQIYHIIPKRVGAFAIEVSKLLSRNVGSAS
jgi:hypothetical protein